MKDPSSIQDFNIIDEVRTKSLIFKDLFSVRNFINMLNSFLKLKFQITNHYFLMRKTSFNT